MEIIKRGQKPEDKIYDATCYHCKTQVRFQRSEARISPDPRDTNVLTVTCPVCNHHIYVTA